VLTYNGDIITGFYSSSTGGVTVDAEDAWGSNLAIPYLRAKETPWENYMKHYNAFWMTEVSPTDLLNRLHQAGYTTLSGAVADVFIEEFANNSTYIKCLGVTDIYGNTIYIKNTDAIRTSLTPYVNSSNFVIGKGSVQYTEGISMSDSDSKDESKDGLTEETKPVIPPETTVPSEPENYDKDFGYINISTYTVMTGDGVVTCEREEIHSDGETKSNISILTADGEINYLRPDAFVMTVQNAGAFLGEEYVYEPTTETESLQTVSAPADSEEQSISAQSAEEILYKTAYAKDENNFIIVGKGWGHGVGMSQWGAHDLALLGKSAEEILHAYFTDIVILDYYSTKDFLTRFVGD
jgi:peptidoglycan hydrolase-like amidase